MVSTFGRFNGYAVYFEQLIGLLGIYFTASFLYVSANLKTLVAGVNEAIYSVILGICSPASSSIFASLPALQMFSMFMLSATCTMYVATMFTQAWCELRMSAGFMGYKRK